MKPSHPPTEWDLMTPHQRHAWRKNNNTNKTGFVGVKSTKDGKFNAKIFDPGTGKPVHIGTLLTAQSAGEAYEREFLRIYGTEEEWVAANPMGDSGSREPNPKRVAAVTSVRLSDDEQAALMTIASTLGCRLRNGRPSWRKMMQEIAAGCYQLRRIK